MNIAKFQHACFSVTHHNETIIVDPGNFTTDLEIPDTVIGVIITHIHPDHCDESLIRRILNKNPNAVVISQAQVFEHFTFAHTKTVKHGDSLTLGSFTLDFVGEQHAKIHSSIKIISNIGVIINKQVYYPGDSFTLPDHPISTLLLPIAAPWLKMSETIDFMLACSPSVAIPTHDAILSKNGKAIADSLVTKIANANNIEYKRM